MKMTEEEPQERRDFAEEVDGLVTLIEQPVVNIAAKAGRFGFEEGDVNALRAALALLTGRLRGLEGGLRAGADDAEESVRSGQRLRTAN